MKKIIKILIPFVLFFIIGFLLLKSHEKVKCRKQVEQQITNLPDFNFLEINSNKQFSKHLLDTNKSVIFIYFNTECEHCRYELEQISSNINKFNNCQILIISIEEPEIVKTFVKKYNLLNQNNVIILYDKDLVFENIFGNCPFPTSFIYNKKWVASELPSKLPVFLGIGEKEKILKGL